MSKLDKILADYPIGSRMSTGPDRDRNPAMLKQQLKALMLELIGEDDRISGKEHETTLMFREGVNDAKAELRKKVEEL